MLRTAVDALAVLEHVVAHGLDLEGVEEVHEADGVDFRPLLGNLLEEVFLDRGDLALTLELALDEKSGGESLASFGAHEVHLVLRLRNVDNLLVGLAERTAHFDLEIDDLLDFLMGALERGDEVFVGHFGGGTLHHEELAADARVEKIDVALGLLVVRGVDHPLAIDAADADAADRAHERDFADVECRRSRVHRQEVGLARAVGLDEHGVDLHIVVVAVGEERTDRTVAHAGREDLLRAGAGFALEESAGELACGVELLAVFALKREEIDPLARRIGVRHGREDRGVTVRHGNGSRGLHGQEPGFDDELLPADRNLELFGVFH